MPLGSITSVRSARRWWAVFALVMLGAGIYFVVLDRLEQREFDHLVEEARKSEAAIQPGSEEDALHLMSVVNGQLKLESARDLPSNEPGTVSLASSLQQLHHPVGACASYAHVLAKTLMTAGYDVRKVGLQKDGKRSIHHVIEARVHGDWVLMDAFYNQSFRDASGHLVGAHEVSADWHFYRRQVPPDYNPAYDYQDYYHTNWDRVPVLGAVMKAVPGLVPWLESRGVSVRFWFFNSYRWFAGLSLALACVSLWRWCRARRISSVNFTAT